MDTQMTSESLSSDGKIDKMDDKECELNCRQIVCKRCSSVILRAKQAKLLDKEIQLPVISKDRSDKEENFNRVLLVDDMYTFENMGFSNTLQNRKYLVCADCEHGPIGFMTNEDKKSYVALDRVEEKD